MSDEDGIAGAASYTKPRKQKAEHIPLTEKQRVNMEFSRDGASEEIIRLRKAMAEMEDRQDG